MNAVLGASLLIANAITAITAQTVPQQSNSSSSIRTQRCNTAFFESILVNGSTLVIVDSLDNGSAYGQGGLDLAYPAVPTNLPACCAAIINVTSSPTSAYQVAIFLPDDWNDRFLVVGNGGFGGGINWEDMAAGSHYGFASVSTDTGHDSTVADLSWAYLAPESRIDWGYRSIHGSVTYGKALTSSYYGNASIKYSYYSGCSTGGRQGLKEVQISPNSFDGALIGSAAWDTDVLNNYATQVGLYDLPATGPEFVSTLQFPILADEVVRQCDGADGVADGIVSAPQLCNFDFQALACGNGSALNASTCFSSAQIEMFKKVYGDWVSTAGEFLYPGFDLSSEDQWYTVLGGPAPTPFGVGYQRYFLYNDPLWPWQDFNDSSVPFAQKYDISNATAAQYNVSAYRDRGGKILMYHGIADGLVPTKGSQLYYNRTLDILGGGQANGIDDFLRLFLVPGMQHCLGTVVNAPWYFAGWSQAAALGTGYWSTPGFMDARHDALLALMAWTEQGQAPDEIIATTWKSTYDPTSGVLQQRPLCPWPQMAHWDGTGNVTEATSWNCQ